jgi:hypothetical protein
VFTDAAALWWTFFTKAEEPALNALKSNGVEALSFYFATGLNFPDALSIGAVAGNWFGGQPGPLFLENGMMSSMQDANRVLMADVAAAYSVDFNSWLKIKKNILTPGSSVVDSNIIGAFRTYVAGGEGVMSKDMLASISSVKYSESQTVGNFKLDANIVKDKKAVRLGGKDRYETSQIIVNTLFHGTNAAGTMGNPVQGVLATGKNFPDALAGSAYAAASNSALWVVPGTCVPQAVLDAGKTLKFSQYALLGGTGALSEAVDTMTACS